MTKQRVDGGRLIGHAVYLAKQHQTTSSQGGPQRRIGLRVEIDRNLRYHRSNLALSRGNSWFQWSS